MITDEIIKKVEELQELLNDMPDFVSLGLVGYGTPPALNMLPIYIKNNHPDAVTLESYYSSVTISTVNVMCVNPK